VQAWQFLKQDDLGKVRTISDFWARAVSTWTPERLSH